MRKLLLAAALLLFCSASAWAGPVFELKQFTPYQGGYAPEWRARGILKNVGEQRAYFVKIYVDLYSRATGEFLKTEYGYVNGSTALTRSGWSVDTTVAPGQWVTFDILFSDQDYHDTEHRDIRVQYDVYNTHPETRANPVVTELTQAKNYLGEWKGLGLVENQGQVTAYFVKVHCDLFSFKDQELGHQEDNYCYLGNGWTYVDGLQGTAPNGTSTGTTLPAGARGGFDTSYSDVAFKDVRYARTTVNWDEYAAGASALMPSAAAGQPLAPDKLESKEAWDLYNRLQNQARDMDPGELGVQAVD
ncbi:hypothetical protein AAU61_01530 [Desulfocarbo indianensis]|nr:hypothetical protein AAU61_01530 [Desulfocarbo indianensis]